MRLILRFIALVLISSNALAVPTIFVCGDSTSKFSGGETMENLQQRNGKPMAGWGTPIAQFFDSAKVTVNNVGHAGTSSRTYYNGDWPRVLPMIKPGDFVLLVFGINDGSTPNGIGDEVIERPVARRGGRGAATQSTDSNQPVQMEQVRTYGWYMSKMATDVRGKGAHVFFLTVTTRNMWSNPKVRFINGAPVGPDNQPLTTMPEGYDPKEDQIERGTGGGRYTQWTKEVAAKLHLPVFDLTNYCADQYEKMGREEVSRFYNDHNHTYLPGAEFIAKCIVAGLKGFKDSPFIPLLSEAGNAIPAADAKYVSDNRP